MNEATLSESSLSLLDISDSQKDKASKAAANKVFRKRKANEKSIELLKKLKSTTQLEPHTLQSQPLQTNSEIFKKTAAAI